MEERNWPGHGGRAPWRRFAGPGLMVLLLATAVTALLTGLPSLSGATIALVVAWVVFTLWDWASGGRSASGRAIAPPQATDALRVALPPPAAFGPEGPSVVRFLHAAAALSPGEWREVALALEARPGGAAGSGIRGMREVAEAWHRAAAALPDQALDSLSTGNLAVQEAVDEMVARGAVPAGAVADAVKVCATVIVVRPHLPDEVRARAAAPFKGVLPRGILD